MKTAEEIVGIQITDTSYTITGAQAVKCCHEFADQFKPKWVSVKERLPEEGQTVAFVVNSDGIRNGFVYGGKYSYGDFCTPGIGFAASHWMPLPDPPKTV